MARRRVRQETTGGGALVFEPAREPRFAILALAGLVAVLIGLGVLAQQAILPRPSGALAGCHTSPSITRYRFADSQPMCIDPSRSYVATIVTTRGNVSVKLDAGAAPVTVNNFVVLAVNHYYDGMRFWRIQDWMDQTGDPYDSGRWTPGYYLPQEGAVGADWKVGDLGMARPPGGFVNGAQFFILKLAWPAPGPDTTYNKFGSVVSGNDILQQIDGSDRIVDIQVRAA